MLAYVFWHWPAPTVHVDEYTARLGAYHAALRAHSPAGFTSSAAFALPALPWHSPEMPPAPPYFEDWYLVQDFATLGALNEAAVSGPRQPSHDLIASEAAGGAGGIYGLRLGRTDPIGVRFATWFGKPASMTYAALFDLLAPLVGEHGGALWQRQMVLGPASEFCWQSPALVSLPAPMSVHPLPLKCVFPTPSEPHQPRE